MSVKENTEYKIIRLTALWALNEAAFGGVLHLFRSPFTGILVGGIAVLIIAMIAHVSTNRWKDIPKALIIVLIIKGMASPHSPITAYIAVAFQGCMGALLYTFIPNFRLATLMLGILALMESALQKVIVLTLLFGKSLWDSIDIFIGSVLKLFHYSSVESVDASLWIVSIYLGLYAFFGVFIGWLGGRLPEAVSHKMMNLSMPQLQAIVEVDKRSNSKKKFWQRRVFKWMVLSFILMTCVYFWIPSSSQFLSPLFLSLRIIVLIAIWYLLIAPIIMKLLQNILSRKAIKYKSDVDEALSLIPTFKTIVIHSWEETKSLSIIHRVHQFVILVISYALTYKS